MAMSLNVNVFCLQEVRRNAGSKFIIDELLDNLGVNWHAKYFDFGLCTLWDATRLEAVDFELLLLPTVPKLYSYEKLFLKLHAKIGKNKHQKIAPSQRTALLGEFKTAGQTLRITNLHLDWQRGFKHRGSQLNFLKSHLQTKTPVDCEILCGDFNTIGFYRFANGKLKRFKNLVGEEFVSNSPKRPTTNHFQLLDHIFVKNLPIPNTKILKYKGSDHFPILAEITI